MAVAPKSQKDCTDFEMLPLLLFPSNLRAPRGFGFIARLTLTAFCRLGARRTALPATPRSNPNPEFRVGWQPYEHGIPACGAQSCPGEPTAPQRKRATSNKREVCVDTQTECFIGAYCPTLAAVAPRMPSRMSHGSVRGFREPRTYDWFHRHRLTPPHFLSVAG